ncbi:MAG TPA: ABC transporter ATP-binding protein [Ktedonobacteraceae bacterium]|nr:ABC transporter ATP-binding protein [Ktedonobacteraceae bacterium]
MLKYLVRCANLIKIYKVADLEAIALQGLDLEVAPGEMIALVGASGSGKTTLLNILGGLDVPTAGQASVGDYDLTRLSEEQRTRYRNLVVGYLWQQSGRNLLPDLTIADNIDLPQILNGTVAFHSSQRTYELLELVGLKGMEKKRPAQLSGGEQQRAAIAVALANRPALLLADEPTGELDSVTARGIIACLRQINMQFGLTIILVTHDVAVASGVDRTLAIRDGRINTETVRRNAPLTHEEAALDGARSKGTSTAIGLSLSTHRESILVDAVGRLQLPKEALERLPIHGRLDVQILDDHIELWPISMRVEGSAYHALADQTEIHS